MRAGASEINTVLVMQNGVPTTWLSADRAAQAQAGAEVAKSLIEAVFPPRAEDVSGTLAVATVETLSNRALRLGMSSVEASQRRWWLEGFVAGYCDQAARVLVRAGDELEINELEQLAHMRTSIAANLDADSREASETIFSFVQAVMTDDEIGAAWAIENLFAVPPGSSHEVAGARVKSVCGAALMTTCASWQVLLLGART